MIIDDAIRTFTEKYDSTAMEYIDELSNNFGMNANDQRIKAFNIDEAFNKFDEFMRGYADYKCNNKDNPKAESQDQIMHRTKDFIESQIFNIHTNVFGNNPNIKYREIPDFIKGYVNGVQKLLETVDDIKKQMMEADVELESIGDVNEVVDDFMEKMDEHFYEVMDYIEGASGYKYHHKKKEVQKKPVIL